MEYIMLVIPILYYAVLIMYGYILLKSEQVLPLIFLISQAVMFTGILRIIEPSNKADQLLVIIYFIVQIIFAFGVECSKKVNKFSNQKRFCKKNVLTKAQLQRIWCVVIVAVLLCIYMFSKMGFNAMTFVMKNLISGGISDSNLKESRLASYGIAGVGYIYQFRVILLPVLCTYLITFVHGLKNKIIVSLLFIMMLFFILGTGQRGGFVIYAISCGLAFVFISKFGKRKIKKSYLIIGGILFVFLFSIMTVSNGRVTSDNQNVFGAILDRFVSDNQNCAVIGFRYIYEAPTQWGKDWFFSAMDILPGKNDYIPLASQIFKILYGSTRGTAPPCMWGSVYFNWGLSGILIFPYVLGILFNKVNCRLYKYPVTYLRVFIYSFIFVLLGTWVADSPVVLFNSGVISLCILGKILHIDRNANRQWRQEVLEDDISNNASI